MIKDLERTDVYIIDVKKKEEMQCCLKEEERIKRTEERMGNE